MSPVTLGSWAPHRGQAGAGVALLRPAPGTRYIPSYDHPTLFTQPPRSRILGGPHPASCIDRRAEPRGGRLSAPRPGLRPRARVEARATLEQAEELRRMLGELGKRLGE